MTHNIKKEFETYNGYIEVNGKNEVVKLKYSLAPCNRIKIKTRSHFRTKEEYILLFNKLADFLKTFKDEDQTNGLLQK